MKSLFASVLHIPEGINFDCTGCGNCCFHWPVPATAQDVERITSLVAASGSSPRFRKLNSTADKLKAFTHSLEKGADGRCQYLDENLRCQLHKDFGAESKPAMCQLFPYTFTLTPSGAYASLSFASTGVLLNSGTPLIAQEDFLLNRLELFMQLFPSEPDWSSIQLVDGVPLKWIDYLLIEKMMLDAINPSNERSISRENLLVQSRFLISKLPQAMDLDNAHLTKVRPLFIDQVLIKLLYEMYFVDDVYHEAKTEFDQKAFLAMLAEQQRSVVLQYAGKRHSGVTINFKSINELRLGVLPPDFSDLLIRFLYCRIFSKLYFGPGFGGLSLLAGFHHLVVLMSLVRIHLKIVALSSAEDPVLKLKELDFVWFSEQIRILERRLTVATLSRESHAILEVLLQSPARIDRILSLAA